jgi:hypothetical protein
VDNRQYSSSLLREAIQDAAKNSKPIELLVKSGDFYSVHRVDYHGGERYPHLVRNESTPDMLSQIIAPLAGK